MSCHAHAVPRHLRARRVYCECMCNNSISARCNRQLRPGCTALHPAAGERAVTHHPISPAMRSPALQESKGRRQGQNDWARTRWDATQGMLAPPGRLLEACSCGTGRPRAPHSRRRSSMFFISSAQKTPRVGATTPGNAITNFCCSGPPRRARPPRSHGGQISLFFPDCCHLFVGTARSVSPDGRCRPARVAPCPVPVGAIVGRLAGSGMARQ